MASIAHLYEKVLNDMTVSRDSIHGPEHWKRVERNGLYLAPHTGASTRFIRLFALLHDCMRENDGRDPEHGPRAAEYIKSLKGEFLKLPEEELVDLCYACRRHTDGSSSSNPNIGTCWDADRLDLTRIGIVPMADYLSTVEAKRLASSGDLTPLRWRG